MLNSVCPVSVAVADKHIRMTKGKSLKEVLKLEFRAMRFQQRLVNIKNIFRTLSVLERFQGQELFRRRACIIS